MLNESSKGNKTRDAFDDKLVSVLATCSWTPKISSLHWASDRKNVDRSFVAGVIKTNKESS